MTRILTALFLAFAAGPAAAGGIFFDFPVLTWPEPAPAPASRDTAADTLAPAPSR